MRGDQWEKFIGPIELPEKSGIYMVMGWHGRILYIGSSGNIRKRLTAHNQRDRLLKEGCCDVRYLVVDQYKEKMERFLIAKWKPVLNGPLSGWRKRDGMGY